MKETHKMKFGKKPAVFDSRTLILSNYLKPKLPPVPKSIDWSSTVSTWGLMLNTTLNNCTIAAAAHQIQLWTSQNDGEFTAPDADIVTAYEAISGYDPSKPNSDNGASMLDALKYWRKKGISGHNIEAFVGLRLKDIESVKEAIYIYGGCYIGLQLPASAQTQSYWDVLKNAAPERIKPGSWDAHAVNAVAYDETSCTVVTWGMLQQMSWEFYEAYCDEAFAILSADWFGADKIAPSRLNLKALRADLKAVTGNEYSLT